MERINIKSVIQRCDKDVPVELFIIVSILKILNKVVINNILFLFHLRPRLFIRNIVKFVSFAVAIN